MHHILKSPDHKLYFARIENEPCSSRLQVLHSCQDTRGGQGGHRECLLQCEHTALRGEDDVRVTHVNTVFSQRVDRLEKQLTG
eukprot:2683169-Amphidinium_carterae.1